MRYYQEVTLLPSQEISLAFLWTKVFRQLHLGFVSMKDEKDCIPVGVSFPGYQLPSRERGKKVPGSMGNVIRLFAEDTDTLEKLGADKYLERLRDFVHITRIRPVPEKTSGYAVYHRVHSAKSIAQKARRYAKRHDISYEEAEKRFSEENLEVKLPYMQISSLTNRNQFSLFIKKEMKGQQTNGKFNVYGLSSDSTVPEF